MHVEKKMIVVPALIMITLSMTGVAVTQWNDEIYVEGTVKTGSFALAFDQSELPVCTEFHEDFPDGPLVLGELYGKNIGKTTCNCQEEITDPHTGNRGYGNIILTIENAYPGYRVHVTFTVHNIGQIPVDISGFAITDPMGALTWDDAQGALVDDNGKPIIGMTQVDPVDEQVNPGDKVRSEFGFLIMHDAQEGYTYSFEIAIVYTQWEQTTASAQQTLEVGGGKPYATIQAAIDNASPNDNILVYPGTYNENINIDKSLTVGSAEGAEVTIINTQGAQFGVLISGAGTVATFEGFTVDDYVTVGILAGVSSIPDEVHILNNIVKPGNINNIQVTGGTTGTVIGNEVSGASLESGDRAGTGIIVFGSSNVAVSNNYVHNCKEGIQILGHESSDAPAENNLIENNLVESNGFGITVKGMTIDTIIRYNDVLNNDVGIDIVGTIQGTPLGTEIHQNNIVGNENYGVQSSVRLSGGNGAVLPEEVDATLNWWETVDSIKVYAMVAGPVNVVPWLDESYLTGW